MFWADFGCASVAKPIIRNAEIIAEFMQKSQIPSQAPFLWTSAVFICAMP